MSGGIYDLKFTVRGVQSKNVKKLETATPERTTGKPSPSPARSRPPPRAAPPLPRSRWGLLSCVIPAGSSA